MPENIFLNRFSLFGLILKAIISTLSFIVYLAEVKPFIYLFIFTPCLSHRSACGLVKIYEIFKFSFIAEGLLCFFHQDNCLSFFR